MGINRVDRTSGEPGNVAPIAVVGIGCRFPGGVRNIDGLNGLLASGRTVRSAVPADRWGPEFYDPEGRDGTALINVGAFLPDIDRFDSTYFGVSPREARLIDPQQRLLMEVAWEAMSDAGRTRQSWAGSRTAVFVGLVATDYTLLQSKTLGTAAVGAHYATGVEPSFTAGRVAYAFDLHGPAATIHSACSSSLVAVHQACNSLRAQDCDAAVVGGVSLLVTPDLSVFMSRVGAISPSGDCRPFDKAADGAIRGEGCGVVVLKRLPDALADGDRIYAVIRGSAVNNDGRSFGLTFPNAVAQADLLTTALHKAGLRPGEVDFVEAHGTATPLGDVMELQTLSEIYGADRDKPIHVGSLKAVLGHMDAAAGMAGLLKSILVVNSGRTPGQPNLETLNPAVDWAGGGITTTTGGADLGVTGRVVRAGVSAFGLSGTNAHVILEAPAPAEIPPATRPQGAPYVLLASSHHRDALGEQVGLLHQQLGTAQDDLDDLVASAATRRTQESHRYAAVAADPAALAAALGDPDDPPNGAYAGVAVEDSAPIFVFSGQGGQWPGMAMEFYDADPIMRATLDECDALIRADSSWSLLEELRRGRDESRLDRIEIVQPAIFAVQVGLARWLLDRGVRPAALVGHSLGEIAAAHIAGALTLPDAVRLVLRRSGLLRAAAGSGRMTVVAGERAQVEEILAATGRPVAVASVNGPAALVLAGEPGDLTVVEAELKARGLHCTPLRATGVAGHSPAVRALAGEFHSAIADLEPAEPALRLVSTVDPTAEQLRLDAAYWVRNLTETVQLWPAVDRLLAEDGHPIVEIGPHPVLLPSLIAATRRRERRTPVVAVLNHKEPALLAAHKALAHLHVVGVEVDWSKVTGTPGRYRTLPVPSWRGGHYWLPGVERGQQSAAPQQPVPPTEAAVTPTAHSGKASGAAAETVAAPSPAPAVIANGANATTSALPMRSAVRRPGGRELEGRVDALVREVLELQPGDALSRRRGLFEQGVDSATAIRLRIRLVEEFGVALPSTIVFEYPTILGLAEQVAAAEPVATAAEPATATGPAGSALSAESVTQAVPGAVAESVTGAAPVATPGIVPASGAAADAGAVAGRAAGVAGAGSEVAGASSHGTPAVADDAVAVIGMSCRLPKAGSAQDFWTLLSKGRDAVTAPPNGRRADPIWAGTEAFPALGAYLDDIAGFDAPFFRISPREAETLDPQQRLFLEVAWEALEQAGCPAHTLAEQPVGVYAGLSMADYQQLFDTDPDRADLYQATGTSFAALAGRLSYFLGLRGPSLTVDTACSASLTALHLACQALRTGDCELAIVGAASTIAAPNPQLAAMAVDGGLARDGRSKPFDEAADGFGLGEGVAVVVLKPLAAAERDGDRIHAVIRGTAVNHDGASGGFTVPSGPAQSAVIETALRRVGWAPHDVDYVETHGTGTPLGDPIEVRALAASLGTGRAADDPLLIGAVKANIGHLGAAAGLAGLLKVFLALEHQQLPPQPLGTLSSRIDWDRLPVSVVTELRPWPRRNRPRRAGVSAFGLSGTNAHVLVEEYAGARNSTAAAPRPAGRRYVLVVTAGTRTALRSVAADIAEVLRKSPERVDDIVFTANHRRSLLDHRLVVAGADAAELHTALAEFAAGGLPAQARLGHVDAGERQRVALSYGDALPSADIRQRLAASTDYQRALAVCAQELTRLMGEPQSLDAEPSAGLAAAYTLCHQVAATQVWQSAGVRVDAVVAGPGGAVATAWAAGELGLTEALALLLPGADQPLPIAPTSADSADLVVDVFGADQSRTVGLTLPDQSADPLARLALIAAELFAGGVRPAVTASTTGRFLDLPAYPWEHRNYWYRGTAAHQPTKVPVAQPGLPEPVAASATRSPAAQVHNGAPAANARTGQQPDHQSAEGLSPTAPDAQPQNGIQTPHATQASVTTQPLARRLATLPQAQRDNELLDLVCGAVATVLRFPSTAAVDPEQPFQELGLDSVTGVELRNQLAAQSGVRLSPAVIFDHPTAATLAAHLGDRLTAAAVARPAEPQPGFGQAASLRETELAELARVGTTASSDDEEDRLIDALGVDELLRLSRGDRS